MIATIQPILRSIKMRSTIISRASQLTRTRVLSSAPPSITYRAFSSTTRLASDHSTTRSHSTTAISPSSTAHSALFPPTHSSTSIFQPLDTFAPRHIGPRGSDEGKMLDLLGYQSMEEFVSETVPANIRIKELDDQDIRPLSELEFMRRAERLAEKNQLVKSYIGMG